MRVKKGAWGSCKMCHTVGWQPPGTRRRADRRVTELGVACEACHGPAGEHVEANQNPVSHDRLHVSGQADSTIIHPEQLSAQRASQICAQCHGVFVFKFSAQSQAGKEVSYRPGDDLEQDRHFVRYTTSGTEPWLKRWHEGSPTLMEQYFWPDGTVRVSGREYNGLITSGCFQRGELSCLSCHSMHDSDPNAQLRASMDGDHACLQCHDSYRTQIQAHTHHPPESAGSRCYNCHMPYTTYGLLRAMRSHRIDSPSAAVSSSTGRPNACNLCHLDKSLAWTATHLTAWYQASSVTVGDDEETVSAALLWLLKGDAVQRAVTAWNMGWDPAHEAARRQWQAPFLIELLTDPYAAVRFNAQRALRQLPGFSDFSYNYVAAPHEREQAQKRARRQWDRIGAVPLEQTGDRVLIAHDGLIQRDRLTKFIGQRDDKPMIIAE